MIPRELLPSLMPSAHGVPCGVYLNHFSHPKFITFRIHIQQIPVPHLQTNPSNLLASSVTSSREAQKFTTLGLHQFFHVSSVPTAIPLISECLFPVPKHFPLTNSSHIQFQSKKLTMRVCDSHPSPSDDSYEQPGTPDHRVNHHHLASFVPP